jgi:integrase
VEDATVDATLPHLPAVVADMVRFQRLCGARPGEVCGMRPCDVDRSGDVWTYRPSSHKAEHHGKDRVVFLGPHAQEILTPYLLRATDAYCFSPADSEKRRKEDRRAKRKTPVQPSQVDRSKPRRQRKPAVRYTKDSYCRVIARACEVAFGMPDELRRIAAKPPRAATEDERQRFAEEKARLSKLAAEWRKEHTWHPNQLRHSAATEIRRQFGLEAAQVTLGHARADVTQVYAERDMTLARDVMKRIG